jgi:DUF4097 and DUF4098 domain-containing protein YvlB
MIRKVFARTPLLCAALALAASATLAQVNNNNSRPSLSCRDQDNSYNDTRFRNCDVKEQTIASTGGTLSVDGSPNGGIAVKGWERSEILVRYRIQTQGSTQAEADSLASQVRVATAGGKIRAEGPETSGKAQWDVSYEIFVPRQTDLSLQTHNGGISVSDVRGRINFEALNGGVSLKRLGGNVSGETVNGGLSVELAGGNWDGEGLNVKTTNGGLSVSVPNNYSAHLETGTVNGHLAVSPSIAEIARETRELSLNLGAGGTNLRIYTTNGGVSIHRSDAR